MQSFKIGIAIFALAALATTAYGHGVQVQITHNAATGKIETHEIIHTDSLPSSISDVKRVYVMPLLPISGGAGNGWYTRPETETNIFGVPVHPTGPGLAYQYDQPSQLPGTGWAFSGSTTTPNLQNTHFAYQFMDGLKEWNGSAFVDPGNEQLQAFRGDGTSVPTVVAATSDAGPFASLDLANIGSQSGNAHHSVGFRLLGDGANPGLSGSAAGDDGIYLASLSVTSTALGANASETFYFVMHKNAPMGDVLAAADHLGFDPSLVQVVPEPASASLLLAGAALICSRRRRGH